MHVFGSGLALSDWPPPRGSMAYGDDG